MAQLLGSFILSLVFAAVGFVVFTFLLKSTMGWDLTGNSTKARLFVSGYVMVVLLIMYQIARQKGVTGVGVQVMGDRKRRVFRRVNH